MPFCAPPTDRTEGIVPIQNGGLARDLLSAGRLRSAIKCRCRKRRGLVSVSQEDREPHSSWRTSPSGARCSRCTSSRHYAGDRCLDYYARAPSSGADGSCGQSQDWPGYAGGGGNPAARAGAAIRCLSVGCVSVLAGECRDHLPGALEDALVQLALDDRPQDRFLAFGVGRVGHLAGPGQLPVCVGSAIAIVTGPVVDRATAAQEDRVRLLEDPPHNRIKQAHGAAEYLY